MKRYAVAAAAFLVLAVALPSAGAEVPLGEPGYVVGPAQHGTTGTDAATPDPQNYGGASLTAVNYAAIGFSPLSDGQWSHQSTGWSNRSGGTNNATCTDIHLPTGALLEAITTYTNDTDAAGDITYTLFNFNLTTSVGTIPFNFVTTGAPGIQRVLRPVTPPLTISNQNRAFSLCLFHGSATATNQNAGATFWYRLQVSPAPATATFPNDVPTSHPLFRFVEALAASGITGGCGAGVYCPDAPITRGQMAVFLAAALGLHFPN
jgi:S-layer homology domain